MQHCSRYGCPPYIQFFKSRTVYKWNNLHWVSIFLHSDRKRPLWTQSPMTSFIQRRSDSTLLTLCYPLSIADELLRDQHWLRTQSPPRFELLGECFPFPVLNHPPLRPDLSQPSPLFQVSTISTFPPYPSTLPHPFHPLEEATRLRVKRRRRPRMFFCCCFNRSIHLSFLSFCRSVFLSVCLSVNLSVNVSVCM